MVRRILFLIGILLFLYPVLSNIYVEKQQQKAISEEASGVIGSVKIPTIGVHLPIYEGVSDEVLEKGVGHIKESHHPGEGQNTHCLLAGHRGLPTAELFTRMGELEVGDRFYVHVPNETYLYTVCRVQVIRPEETDVLGIWTGKELVSLITCTPYGLNTHRLIVTGERTEESNL